MSMLISLLVVQQCILGAWYVILLISIFLKESAVLLIYLVCPFLNHSILKSNARLILHVPDNLFAENMRCQKFSRLEPTTVTADGRS
ncbi:hypothetical protein JHK82_029308 [Glycine max]|uniref:Uncharacterized protein n=2 Tax=Glycine subgen. Soja TaxID=1462606 RepID=K7LLL2_SOYBN|nr:hypothetical protein JHK85_029955 [Glycine max]RZB89259.1 hypothetical protein D0Y65_028217 [Glycine soja]KAG5005283.1 hypothetical protein JHK86_029422 [Glycine max]KAG5128473.1 hypothetical protein JHK82_029308 [Glycine max]KAG5153078.1 hypothetical protein JHK84_029550 [Glycine max]